jgi:hypothetical protein
VNRSSHKASNHVSYTGAAIERIYLLQIGTHFESQPTEQQRIFAMQRVVIGTTRGTLVEAEDEQ